MVGPGQYTVTRPAQDWFDNFPFPSRLRVWGGASLARFSCRMLINALKCKYGYNKGHQHLKCRNMHLPNNEHLTMLGPLTALRIVSYWTVAFTSPFWGPPYYLQIGRTPEMDPSINCLTVFQYVRKLERRSRISDRLPKPGNFALMK